MIELQQNNPLHGLKLETMVTELVDFYDWKILFAALKLQCFNQKPSIESCVKFLKKTEWAREKVENFYLYRFKRMPKATAHEFALKPRERGFAHGVKPREPQVLTLELIEQMQAKAAADYAAKRSHTKKPAAQFAGKPRGEGEQSHKRSSEEGYARRIKKRAPSQDPSNPWGK